MRWGWKVALLAFIFLVALLAALFAWYDRSYYYEFNAINERLSAIPGVRVGHMGGNHDITYEDLFADLEVTGKGRLDLHNLTLASYDNGKGLQLLRLGGLAPRIAGCDHLGTWRMSDDQRVRSTYQGYGIDIGPSGHFASDLSGGIKGVEDAVRRFDELERWFASWPVCPRSEYRKTPEGWFRYCVEHIAPTASSLDAASFPSQAPDGGVLSDGPCTEAPKPRSR